MCVSRPVLPAGPQITGTTVDIDAATAAPGLSVLIVRWQWWCGGGWRWAVARDWWCEKVLPDEIITVAILSKQWFRYEMQLSRPTDGLEAAIAAWNRSPTRVRGLWCGGGRSSSDGCETAENEV